MEITNFRHGPGNPLPVRETPKITLDFTPPHDDGQTSCQAIGLAPCSMPAKLGCLISRSAGRLRVQAPRVIPSLEEFPSPTNGNCHLPARRTERTVEWRARYAVISAARRPGYLLQKFSRCNPKSVQNRWRTQADGAGGIDPHHPSYPHTAGGGGFFTFSIS